MKREVSTWQAERNSNAMAINWQFGTNDAKIKLKSLYPKIEAL